MASDNVNCSTFRSSGFPPPSGWHLQLRAANSNVSFGAATRGDLTTLVHIPRTPPYRSDLIEESTTDVVLTGKVAVLTGYSGIRKGASQWPRMQTHSGGYICSSTPKF